MVDQVTLSRAGLPPRLVGRRGHRRSSAAPQATVAVPPPHARIRVHVGDAAVSHRARVQRAIARLETRLEAAGPEETQR
jgi:hypothetical protein